MGEINDSYIGLRTDLLKFITGKNNFVLDVGCAIGTNGMYLLENNFAEIVYGIEYDTDMALLAEKHNTKVLCGDLNSSEFINKIINQEVKFDYILFGDILEHLINPLEVLIALKKILKVKGKIIISLPNVAHLELFIQIYLKGTFPQNSRGIFDKTHIRWFTRKDVFELLQASKLRLLIYERKYRSRDALGSKFNWKYRLIKWLKKDLVTFQHIVVCERE